VGGRCWTVASRSRVQSERCRTTHGRALRLLPQTSQPRYPIAPRHTPPTALHKPAPTALSPSVPAPTPPSARSCLPLHGIGEPLKPSEMP
jgi:hypothetical protein